MKLIDSYIIKTFLASYFFATASFVMLFNVLNFALRIDFFLDKNVPLKAIFQYYVEQSEQTMALLLPMGMLLGGLYSVGKFNKQNELIAIKASGISLYRFMLPFLLVGVVSTIFNFYLTGWRVPMSKHQEKIFEETFTGGTGYIPMSRSNFNLYDSTNRFLFVKFYSEETGMFSNVAIQEFETGQITRRIDAKAMKYDTLRSKWILLNGVERVMKGDNITFHSFEKKDSVKLGFSVSDILASKKTPDELSLTEHKNFLELRKKLIFGGTEEIEVKWHEKISFPFACLIVSLLVVPIASQQRKAGLGLWSGISIGIGFFYFGLQKSFAALGYSGTVPILVAAWLPNALFLLVGIIFVIQARK